MTSLLKGALRGLGAGAAGTTALDLTTHADMAVRGRPASRVPETVVSTLAARLGTAVPGRGAARENRRHALGALAGASTGLAVGAVAGVLRAAGVRMPTAIGGPLLGAAAMVATDLPIARLRISDPREWSREDWIADAVPHLVYGVVTHATLVAAARAEEGGEDRSRTGPSPAPTAPHRPRPRAADLLRAVALGSASGCRSSAGLTAVALSSAPADDGPAHRLAGPLGRALPVLLTVGELGGDKHPSIPDRTALPGLAPRVTLGAVSSGAVARRDGVRPALPCLVGALAAVTTAAAGQRARAALRHRLGTDLPGALLEDLVAAGLAAAGTRRPAPADRRGAAR